jgi:hypothetical protein
MSLLNISFIEITKNGSRLQTCRDDAAWLLAVGCWLLAVGCWLLAVGCWLLAVYSKKSPVHFKGFY